MERTIQLADISFTQLQFEYWGYNLHPLNGADGKIRPDMMVDVISVGSEVIIADVALKLTFTNKVIDHEVVFTIDEEESSELLVLIYHTAAQIPENSRKKIFVSARQLDINEISSVEDVMFLQKLIIQNKEIAYAEYIRGMTRVVPC